MRGRVEICGINTAKLPVLKHEENMELLRRVKQGDEQARQQLICGNLRLVLAAVKRFAGRGENVDDLFQVGCIGLMKSIDAFDLSYDVRLSSYSLPMIIGEIRRYLRDNSPLRVSRSVRDTAYRVLQAREKLLARQQREPTVEQIARELGRGQKSIDNALQRVKKKLEKFLASRHHELDLSTLNKGLLIMAAKEHLLQSEEKNDRIETV